MHPFPQALAQHHVFLAVWQLNTQQELLLPFPALLGPVLELPLVLEELSSP